MCLVNTLGTAVLISLIRYVNMHVHTAGILQLASHNIRRAVLVDAEAIDNQVARLHTQVSVYSNLIHVVLLYYTARLV
jgi:conjugal transfer/entry exclusion protein